jgi:RNA polymerase sigma factor (sigma-70 family)
MDNKNSAPYEWIALRCQSGEMSAFEDLVAVMERPLLYYAASLTGSQDSGLDVLQEVWIRVLRDIRKLKDPGSLRSWLYTITHGIAVDRIRRNVSHEKALFWEKIPSTVGYVIAFAVFIVNWFWGQKFDAAMTHFFWFWAGLAYFGGAVIDLRYRIYRSKVDMLKEVKQVQLQILELQASLQKRSSE